MSIEVAPVQQNDLAELLTFAFCAGAGFQHPMYFTPETAARCKEYVAGPAPRSTFQRVSHAIEEQIKADEDQWITWPGYYGCPLGLNVRHKLRYRDGQESQYTTKNKTGEHRWLHTGRNSDIVAYKLEPIEERQLKAKENAKKLLVGGGFANDLEDAARLIGE